MNIFDFDVFKTTIFSLKAAWKEYLKYPQNLFIRDACIHRFKYNYELSHKTLKHYLSMTEPSQEIIQAMSYPDLIRTGYEKGLLLSEWKAWKIYREARNLTSHTYDQIKAQEVCEVISGFLKDAEFLLAKLQDRVAQ